MRPQKVLQISHTRKLFSPHNIRSLIGSPSLGQGLVSDSALCSTESPAPQNCPLAGHHWFPSWSSSSVGSMSCSEMPLQPPHPNRWSWVHAAAGNSTEQRGLDEFYSLEAYKSGPREYRWWAQKQVKQAITEGLHSYLLLSSADIEYCKQSKAWSLHQEAWLEGKHYIEVYFCMCIQPQVWLIVLRMIVHAGRLSAGYSPFIYPAERKKYWADSSLTFCCKAWLSNEEHLYCQWMDWEHQRHKSNAHSWQCKMLLYYWLLSVMWWANTHWNLQESCTCTFKVHWMWEQSNVILNQVLAACRLSKVALHDSEDPIQQLPRSELKTSIVKLRAGALRMCLVGSPT